jgi:putative flippase GtrA
MHFSKQMARFLFVGVFTNTIFYFLYLIITYIGIDHKYAMTIVYVLGVSSGFLLNKKWTFNHQGDLNTTFTKYLILYFCGYFLNLAGLWFLVDRAGYPHQFVQLGLAVIMAIFFFVAQRTLVFKNISY